MNFALRFGLSTRFQLLLVGVVALISGISFTGTIQTTRAVARTNELTATGPEALMLCLGDPYLLVYGLWPIAVLTIAKCVATSYRTVLLVRLGGPRGYVASSVIAGLVVAAFIQLTAVGVGLATALPLPWRHSQPRLGTIGLDVLAPLNPDSTSAGQVLVDILLQLAYFFVSCVLLALVMSFIRIRHESGFRIFIGLFLAAPPILLKLWPESLILINPINLLISFRARGAGIHAVAPLVLCLVLVLWIRGTMSTLGHLLLRQLAPAWLLFGGIVLVGMLLVSRQTDLGENSLFTLFYGGSPDSMSFLTWSFEVIFWQGMALVLVLQWSTFINERAWVELIRYGSGVKKLAFGLLADLAVVYLVTAASLLLLWIGDEVRSQHGHWSSAELLQHLVVGPAIVMSMVAIAVLVMWASGRESAALLVITAGIVGSFPMAAPWWPIPFALMFQSNVADGATSEWFRVVTSLVFASASVAALLLVVSKRSAPSQ